MCSLEFTLSTVPVVAAVVRGMLRATLRNISRVLLNLIAPLISESLIPLLLWQFSKSVWAPFHHKLAQYH